jgi:hypothetical protein
VKTALKLALLASSALFASSAWAQQQPTPPEHYTLDARGVDLVTGDFAYQANDVVIGQPGQGGLVHSRVYANGGWRDTLSGTIGISGSLYTVSLGARSELFVKSGSAFVPVTNRGATLSQSGDQLTYRMSDGTVATYSTAYSGWAAMYSNQSAALVEVRRLNGEQQTYHWGQHHLLLALGDSYRPGFPGRMSPVFQCVKAGSRQQQLRLPDQFRVRPQ